MKKYALITTYYCKECQLPTKEHLKTKFNYDGDIDDLYVNFSNNFDPWNTNNLELSTSGRKDLIYGKIYLLKNFIKQNILNKYEYLCHIDYSDVKFAKSFLEMMYNFEKSGQDFIISTERKCWPPIEVCRKWVDYSLEETEFYFINSGGMISRVPEFLNFLEKMYNLCENVSVDFWDDQGVWQYYNLVIEKLNSDSKCEYFFSTGLLDESYYTVQNNKILTKFQTEPFVIHDNSSYNLDLINKI